MRYMILAFLIGCSKVESFNLNEWDIHCSKNETITVTECTSSNDISNLLIPTAYASDFTDILNPLNPLNPIHNPPCKNQSIEKQICVQYILDRRKR
jgi:hypothetical protein